MKVFINNKERHINSEKISFASVVNYGLYDIPVHDRIAPTVTFRYANQKADTRMEKRTSIRLQDGMSFSVINGKMVGNGTPAINTIDVSRLMRQRLGINRQGGDIEPETMQPRVTVKPEALARRKEELKSKGLDWPPHFTEEQKQAEISRVAELMAPHEARYQAQQAVKRISGITEPEARLKDAYVIINLLFEEMVEAGMQTKGRQIAGRLLYSAGYAETVKHLENNI